MAKFEVSFDKVVFKEGGYVDDPDDKGGETYMGISRKNNPLANFWKDVDKRKKDFGTNGMTGYLKSCGHITIEVRNIYRYSYWNPLLLDDIPSQRLADQLFDDAVNRGVRAAIKLARKICGLKESTIYDNELFEKLKSYGKNN